MRKSTCDALERKLSYSIMHRALWCIDSVRFGRVLRQWTEVCWYPAASPTEERCFTNAEIERFAMAPRYIALAGTAVVQFVWRWLFLLALGLGRDNDTIIQLIFVILIQARQETRETCTSTALVCPPARAFFFHPMHSIRDIKCFLK